MGERWHAKVYRDDGGWQTAIFDSPEGARKWTLDRMKEGAGYGEVSPIERHPTDQGGGDGDA